MSSASVIRVGRQLQQVALFVFGTLLDKDVLRIVLGRALPDDARQAAMLRDHQAQRLHDETYPVLVPSVGHCVHGEVLTLTGRDMDRVRFYEADEYALEPAVVTTASGDTLSVMLCAEHATRPGPRYPWSLRQWQRDHKRCFVRNAQQYMNLYGQMSATQADQVWRALVGRE